ncbi:MAG: Gfo/Idh/MocA family protein [Verrucomicrobiales bacterium]
MTTLSSSRRRFLKTAVAGSAPFILPSGIWSAPVKPNDRITIGFIGMGKLTHNRLRGFLTQEDLQGVAVCDVDSTRQALGKKAVEAFYSEKQGSEFKGCDAYAEYEEIIDRRDIDAVMVATPDHWHAPIAIAAMNAGKDVYCEKPLTHTIQEAKAMVAAVKRQKAVLQTGSQQRSSKEFRIACELVRNGVIGKVKRVEAGFGGPPRPCDLGEDPIEPGLDWSRWLGPAPMRPYSSVLSPHGLPAKFCQWRQFDEYCNGQIGDWGAHHLDIAQWGLGYDKSGPVEVLPPTEEGKPFGGILKYADGSEVHHVEDNGVTFFGEKGKIVVNRGLFQLWWGEKREDREFISAYQVLKAEEKYLKDAKVRLYKSEGHVRDFLDCIRSRKQPICDVEVGAGSAICCQLLNMAYRSGQPVKWDPASRELVEGDKSLIWYGKDRRAPYDQLDPLA